MCYLLHMPSTYPLLPATGAWPPFYAILLLPPACAQLARSTPLLFPFTPNPSTKPVPAPLVGCSGTG